MNDRIQRSAGWWRIVADGDQRPQKGHLIQTGVGLREIQEDFQEEVAPGPTSAHNCLEDGISDIQ